MLGKVYSHGDGIPDPKDMWDILCQHFERRTVSNKVFTLMQLHGLHMKKGAQVQEHLRCLEEFISLQLVR